MGTVWLNNLTGQPLFLMMVGKELLILSIISREEFVHCSFIKREEFYIQRGFRNLMKSNQC